MFFRKKALKCRWGGSRSKFLVCRSFFYRNFVKKNFEVGDPKNRRFWAFFQKSILEISAMWEMGGYFWGCAPKCFFRKFGFNVVRFQFKNEGDRRRTRGVTGPS